MQWQVMDVKRGLSMWGKLPMDDEGPWILSQSSARGPEDDRLHTFWQQGHARIHTLFVPSPSLLVCNMFVDSARVCENTTTS
jgi:hypothetical protein